jgi:hypothetical protein
MKKSLVLCTALLTLTVAATSAFAVGNTINWGGCLGAGANPNQTFDCVNLGGPYNLVLELQPPALAGWFACDLDLDIQIAAPGLDSFWHMDAAGCNATGLSISAGRNTIPNTGCLATYTGSTGASVSSLITAYGVGFGGANRARCLVTVARAASSPIAAALGSNYYLSHLTFSLDNASEAGGTCNGCTQAAAMVYNSTVMYSVSGAGGVGSEAEPLQVNGPGLGTNCASFNGGGAGTCAATPTINKTWGGIKALYR